MKYKVYVISVYQLFLVFCVVMSPLNGGSSYGTLAHFRRIAHDVNVKDSQIGWSCLHWAASKNELECLRACLQIGAHVDDPTTGFAYPSMTALHIAAAQGDCDIVAELIRTGANVDAQDSDGYTPLHDAAHKGYSQIVRFLLEHGASVDFLDYNNMTPLDHAILALQPETVSMLIPAYADRHELLANARITYQDLYGSLYALGEVMNDHIKALAHIGALLGCVPLHAAVVAGQIDQVSALLQTGKRVNEQDARGNTALHYAIQIQNTDMLLFLLHNGASVIICNYEAKTAFDYALEQRNVEGIKLLIYYCAEHNKDFLKTMLHTLKVVYNNLTSNSSLSSDDRKFFEAVSQASPVHEGGRFKKHCNMQ